MEQIVNILKSLIEPTSIILLLILLLFINSWIFKKIKSNKLSGNILKNSVSALVIFVGLLIFILSFPIDKSLKGQILSFLAIVVSAGIALSSTTILGNIIAGIMNNSMNRFRNGDLIEIGDLQGRVTKKSIFHTEIQLEDSNFITIPNLYIASNPVKLTRKTDTVIAISVSLGYDIPRTTIEKLLKEAATLTGLKTPYVYIKNLGDFSVVYKIHGFLEDSSKYFSTISLLNGNVMDVLHNEKIEIVSPTFMNQRNTSDKYFIPKKSTEKESTNSEKNPEDLIFDKAIKSEKIEKKKDQLDELDKQQELLRKKQKSLKIVDEIQKNKLSIKKIDDLKTKVEKSIEKQKEDEDLNN
ncbi:mechanosensitive ion channel family protein [Polaribacter sp. Q13]|uniref:mechanosensitive ion channel family protein n=1 Tax=Polaribacter sp. Q13 TaxID=2806551 RepID=UPI00193BE790|nr:mechanosensitive ion channel domain-containing protein [Polaribacter sp. Q13]QVY67170.1 mechanosensitive ion channel [Polaribacter sp. Q13]